MKKLPRLTGVAALAVAGGLMASAVGLAPPSRTAATPAAASPSSFADLDDDDLWDEIESSGKVAVVGLKAPGAPEGVRQGQVVVDTETWGSAKAAVTAGPGVTLLGADQVRPNVTLALADEAAMRQVRSLPFVEFVEPRSFRAQALAPGAGCTGNAYNGDPEGGDVFTGPVPTVSPGDAYPANFDSSKVQQAWGRAPSAGAGVTVGVVDTGLFPTQSQLQHPQFSSGMSANRWVLQLNSSSATVADECNHGTRVAATIAAPRDGLNMVGIAYRSNLISVKHGADVAIDAWETDAVANGIRAAVDNGARIIEMAFGTGSWEYANIKQEIQYQHGRGVLFVGAAGSSYCWEGVVFPAKMPEVLAVTGVTSSGTLHPEACSGPEVDVAVVIDNMFASGRRSGDLITMGGSSGASAMAAAIAALVWGEHPHLSRDQVRSRLVASGSRCCDSGIGTGVIDAYRAVGGFWGLSISGPSTVEPYETYTLTASPGGDGPFTYRWNNGATTQSITVTAGANNSTKAHSVTVTDTRENKSLTASKSVKAKYDISCLRAPGC